MASRAPSAPRRLLRPSLAAVALVAASTRLVAQAPAGLPRHEPLSPAVTARSGLFVPPFVDARDGWRLGLSLDYGSAVERNLNWPDSYLVDAELARVKVRARRDLPGDAFLELEGGAQGAFAGFADAFFEEYHEVIRWVMEERDARPRNAYGERLYLSRLGVDRTRASPGWGLADARVAAGLRHGANAQSVASLTLPTASAGTLLGRGAPSLSVVHARRWALRAHTAVQGSIGVGYTPTDGELAPVQRSLMYSASAGVRTRVRGAHAVYAGAFYHSAPYRRSGFPELDRGEISADFGYVWRSPGGREWRIGLTEDTRRRDPGIDLVLKVSVE